MSENKERAKGMIDEAVGNVKQGIGNLTGNERLEAEGRAQELGGEARQETAKGVGRLKGAAEEVGGNIKKAAGDLLDNEQMQAEGEAKRLKGQARQDLNQ